MYCTYLTVINNLLYNIAIERVIFKKLIFLKIDNSLKFPVNHLVVERRDGL